MSAGPQASVESSQHKRSVDTQLTANTAILITAHNEGGGAQAHNAERSRTSNSGATLSPSPSSVKVVKVDDSLWLNADRPHSQFSQPTLVQSTTPVSAPDKTSGHANLAV